mgnify:CR=1 FL=1
MINKRTYYQWPLILLAILCQYAIGQEQGFEVRGTVYSTETGSPVAAIGISSANSAIEPVSTDSLGSFRMILQDKNDQLLVSYPGFKEKRVFVQGRAEIEIWLLNEEDISVSDAREMVFRKSSTRDLTGAVEVNRSLDLY